MSEIIEGAGIFIYPLGLCSVLGFYIIFERLFALRRPLVVPYDVENEIMEKRSVSNPRPSALSKIYQFHLNHPDDEEAVKSYARSQVHRLERGLVFLEIIVSAAPLLGLLGTVTGLIQVFSNIDETTGLPEPTAFVAGVALALTTTVLGLAIAIPCLVANSFFQRRVDSYAVEIDTLIERLHSTNDPWEPDEDDPESERLEPERK